MIALLDSTNDVARMLEPKLHERLPDARLEIFSSLGELRRRLSGVDDAPVIAIMKADSHIQLEQFKGVRNTFADVRIVLILPDDDLETIHLGHRLYPRYVSFRNGNFDDLVMVVARMHEKFH